MFGINVTRLYLVSGCLRGRLLDDVNQPNSMSNVVNCLMTEIVRGANAFILRDHDV
jgi:hypothetical protein